MWKYRLLSFFLLGSCSSSQIVLKESLVLPYDFSLEKKKTDVQPYVLSFKKKDKALHYVLASHVPTAKYSDPTQQDATLRTIQKIVDDEKLSAVVVEGIEAWEGNLLPEKVVQKISECEQTKFKGNCGESFFTLSLAKNKKLLGFSGEPMEIEILNEVKKAGYTEEDLIFFYLVRVIPQWKRQGLWHDGAEAPLINRQLKKYAERIGSEAKLNFRDFENWYAKKMSGQKPYRYLVAADAAPSAGKRATFVQKLSHEIGFLRDRSIVKTINRAFQHGDKVLVVYGGSHYLTQEPSFFEAFQSEPLKSKPY